MTKLKGLFSLEKLSLSLGLFTLFTTALTRVLPFEWTQAAAQWGVLTLLIAFILGCASLFVVGVASMLPREQQGKALIEAKCPRPQTAPAHAFTAGIRVKKHR